MAFAHNTLVAQLRQLASGRSLPPMCVRRDNNLVSCLQSGAVVGSVAVLAGAVACCEGDAQPTFATSDAEFDLAAAKFRAICGESNVSVDAEDLSTHGNDVYSYHTGNSPNVVVYPRTTEEVSKVLKYCNQRRLPVGT